MSKTRAVVAVVAGLIAAIVLIAVIEAVGHSYYPVPGHLDPFSPDPEVQAEFRNFVANLPLGALLFVLGAWIVGTFAGGWVAAYVAAVRPAVFANIVGVAILILCFINLAMLPHPIWFIVATVIGVPFASLLATWLAPKGHRPPFGPR
jgi:hypothetical protein